ncbi:hypothetical protein LCGC14_2784230, partial [marine sediment metagenome]
SYSLASAGADEHGLIAIDGRELASSDEFHVFYGYLDQDRDFLESIQQGRRPLTDIEEAVQAMKFVDLLLASRI